MRRAVLFLPLIKTGLDGQPGISPLDEATIGLLFGNTIVAQMKSYESTEGDGNGIISQVESFGFFLNEYYGDTCLEELKEKRDCFPEVPQGLLVAALTPAAPVPAPARV